MGNRVKGKTKKKSIKAALSSNAGSVRKLSRMGKKQKRNHGGLEATFISRSSCLKRLQITLKDFRRLCILKGIYPRQPEGRVPHNKKGMTFYHVRDLTYLNHEPLLQKFRDFKAYMKKVRRASGRNSKDEAKRLDNNKPIYTLHHLVKERYPRFQDALGDLDDALTMMFLFAALPSTGRIKTSVTRKAKECCQHWNGIVARSGGIRKSFVSVRGYYFEAEIKGVTVRWIVPHAFTQNLPEEVDFRVMLTFMEFYDVLLNFVLFKLYHTNSLPYPCPAPPAGMDDSVTTLLKVLETRGDSGFATMIAADNTAAASTNLTTKTTSTAKTTGKAIDAGKILKKVTDKSGQLDSDSGDDDDDDSDNDENEKIDSAALSNALQSQIETTINASTNNSNTLLSSLTIFISREVPRHILEVLALSFGGTVGWEGEGSPIEVADPKITHHIVDRPKLPASYNSLPKNREYIQPQWLFDSTNNGLLLPCASYGVGKELPPHLSPWVDNEKEGYTPRYAEEIERIKKGEVGAIGKGHYPSEGSEEEEEEGGEEGGRGNDDSASDSGSNSDGDGDGDGEEDEGKPKKKNAKKAKSAKDEEHAMALTMMSKKAARLYGRMQNGINAAAASAENLLSKRKAIEKRKREELRAKDLVEEREIQKNMEKGVFSERGGARAIGGLGIASKKKDPQGGKWGGGGKGKNDKGESVEKQKVQRLKRERKRIETEYGEVAGMKISGGNKKKKRKN